MHIYTHRYVQVGMNICSGELGPYFMIPEAKAMIMPGNRISTICNLNHREKYGIKQSYTAKPMAIPPCNTHEFHTGYKSVQ